MPKVGTISANVVPMDEGLTAKILGEHLRRMIARAGMTRSQFADLIGVTRSCVYGWCEGKNITQTTLILRGFEMLGCSVKILPPVKPALNGEWSGAGKRTRD